MKPSKCLVVVTVLLFSMAVFTFSCSKKDDGGPTQPTETVSEFKQSSEDHAFMDGEFNSIFNTIDNVANSDSTISYKTTATVLPTCATKTFDLATKTLTVDFGTTNCLCADGLNRRGKVIAVFSGKYRTKGTKVTITLSNYFVDNIEIKGQKTIENLGNSSGNFKYAYEVINAEALTPTGTIKWQTSATIERIQGDATFTPWDDIYSGTGTSSGTSRTGKPFTVVIDPNNPLIREISLNPLCWRNFVSGILTITDNSSNVVVLDYDPNNTGNCDRMAQLTFNGGTPFTIFLR